MLILSSKELSKGAQFLKDGEVVAFPTETVYGLGADIFNETAIRKVFTLKNRPADNPLIAHISSFDQLPMIAREIPFEFYVLADPFFPGPLTIILKRNYNIPAIVSAGLDTIAVRMPRHSIARELISLVGRPLVGPSANLSGKPSSTKLEHIVDDFEGRLIAAIDGGDTELGIESTVISLYNPERPLFLRPGSITQEEIENILKVKLGTTSNAIISPGMKYHHYAPLTPLRLIDSLEEYAPGPKKHLIRNVSAKTLYAALRAADKGEYDEIVILLDDTIKQNVSLMNRLLRATNKLMN